MAQILLKYGMTSPSIQNSFESSFYNGVIAVLSNIYVVGGLFAYVTSAAVWLGVLTKIEVSKAYPFVGLGFIGTMLFAYYFLNEPLTVTKCSGTLLIIAGVLLVTK